MADPVVALNRLGGVARWGQLRRTCSRRRLRRALQDGGIVRTARGRYAVPVADRARVAASRLTGHVSHTSAALHWGWPVKPSVAPLVTVPRHWTVATARRDDVVVHYRDLAADEIRDRWVTSPVRTVVDCCLDLPFDEDPFEPVLLAIVTSVPGLVARRWLVLRFTWMQVMFEPGLVAETVRAVVDLRRTGRRSGGTRVVRTTKSA